MSTCSTPSRVPFSPASSGLGYSSYIGSPLGFEKEFNNQGSLINEEATNIKVLCRIRPLLKQEKSLGDDIIECVDPDTVVVRGKENTMSYSFDHVFPQTATQNDVYDYSIKKTVDDFMSGYNGTILAYGQTGSGKSYTMFGSSIADDENRGLIPRICSEIFESIEKSSSDTEYTVSISYFEIYMEQIRDLLNPANVKCKIHEDKVNGIYVKDLSQAFVSSPEEVYKVLVAGSKERTSTSTNMNIDSSRSHAMVQVKLVQKKIDNGSIKRSNLFLVDLAGSEKVNKTGAFGQTLEEAKKINSSLSSLGNVINALTDGKSPHIPYRDSKLTRILQEALGGNSRTSLVINCSPLSTNESESLSTLRFGSRAKKIKNKAHVNTELSIAELKSKLKSMESMNRSSSQYIKYLEGELQSARMSDLSIIQDEDNSSPNPETPIKNMQHINYLSQKDFNNRFSLSLSSPIMVNNTQNEEIARRDKKIEELENTIFNMKVENLKTNHQEESKFFQLENSLIKLSEKLNDIELINSNLRKHLMINEKIIESRNNKINELTSLLKDQKLHILQESESFESKINYLKSRFLGDSKKPQEVNVSENDEYKKFTVEDDSIKNLIMRDSIEFSPENRSLKGTRSIDSSFSGSPRRRSSSPNSLKAGLNLKIVKPIRGGNEVFSADSVFFSP